jgi:hypothetical protein
MDLDEYGRLFLSAELAFRSGYMCGVSDMEIERIGNKPMGESARWETHSRSLKSWDPGQPVGDEKGGEHG